MSVRIAAAHARVAASNQRPFAVLIMARAQTLRRRTSGRKAKAQSTT
jgi:hypothetical protein